MFDRTRSATLEALLGPQGWLTEDLDAFATDWLSRVSTLPYGVARPNDLAAVVGTIAFASAHGIPVTPQGGNTGLCAGGVPGADGAIVLSLSRMDKVLSIDEAGLTVLVEAGCTLDKLQAAVADRGLMLPLSLGSSGTAQIGGLIATNAGGSQAFRYGLMQDLVLGLEVVLSDGSIWDGVRRLLKDNAGYQLRRLFCGSEGTFGVVTKAVLRLQPLPRQTETAFLGLPHLARAVEVGSLLRRELCDHLSALEFFTDVGMEFLREYLPGADCPLSDRAGCYLLVEARTSSARAPLKEVMEGVLGDLIEAQSIADAALASNERQRRAFWRLREELPEAQRLAGRQLKHDISVPTDSVATFVSKANAFVQGLASGTRSNPFGHLADGNIHYNLTPAIGADGFGGQEEVISNGVYALAVEMGGSFAAEHGLGRFKVTQADRLRGAVERGLMRDLKRALDPQGLMNPGVVVAAD